MKRTKSVARPKKGQVSESHEDYTGVIWAGVFLVAFAVAVFSGSLPQLIELLQAVPTAELVKQALTSAQ